MKKSFVLLIVLFSVNLQAMNWQCAARSMHTGNLKEKGDIFSNLERAKDSALKRCGFENCDVYESDCESSYTVTCTSRDNQNGNPFTATSSNKNEAIKKALNKCKRFLFFPYSEHHK